MISKKHGIWKVLGLLLTWAKAVAVFQGGR